MPCYSPIQKICYLIIYNLITFNLVKIVRSDIFENYSISQKFKKLFYSQITYLSVGNFPNVSKVKLCSYDNYLSDDLPTDYSNEVLSVESIIYYNGAYYIVKLLLDHNNNPLRFGCISKNTYVNIKLTFLFILVLYN